VRENFLAKQLTRLYEQSPTLFETYNVSVADIGRMDWHSQNRFYFALTHNPGQYVTGNNWAKCVLRGGRGSGKTYASAQWVVEQAYKYPESQGVIIGRQQDDLFNTCFTAILKLFPQHHPERPRLNEKKRQLFFPNGTIITGYVASKPEQIRGLNGSWAWIDELSTAPNAELIIEQVDLAIRLGSAQTLISTTPFFTSNKLMKEIESRADTIVQKLDVTNNFRNLAPSFQQNVLRKVGTRFETEEIKGDYLEQEPDAFVRKEDIQYGTAESYRNIIISVDPAVTVSEKSDETGIIVLGQANNKIYVIDDLSGKYPAEQWVKIAVKTAQKWKAKIIVEDNQGKDLIDLAFKSYDTRQKIFRIHQKMPKVYRLEKAAIHYATDMVVHTQEFEELEEQQKTITYSTINKIKDDRWDALATGIRYYEKHHPLTIVNKERTGILSTDDIISKELEGLSPERIQHLKQRSSYSVTNPANLWHSTRRD